MNRTAYSRSAHSISRWSAVVALLIIFGTPFLWMTVSAFKSRADIFADTTPLSWRTFVPSSPTLENFTTLFFEQDFGRAILNTLALSIAAVLLALPINSAAAYVLAWIDFPGRKVALITVIGTMFIVFEAKVVPLFLIMQDLRIQDSYFSIIAPWVADAFLIFLFYQHFRALPKELMDAARIDGASYFRVYWSVMLPNLGPALVSAALIKFIFTWDSYLWPLLSVTDTDKTVVSVAIAKLFADEEVLWELVFAASFISTIPMIVLFLVLQRYYIQGIAQSGLKG